MWALRRAASPLRSRSHLIVSACACANLEILHTGVKNGGGHCGNGCHESDCLPQPKLSVFRPAFSSSSFTWSRNLSSKAGTKSSDKEDELEDGFSDLEAPPEADKVDEELTSEVDSDEEVADALALSETEADKKAEKGAVKQAYKHPLLKVILEAPRHGVSGPLDKWVGEGNSLDRSDVFFVVLILRKRKQFVKALQLLEWLEESKQLEFKERDYASRVDLIAKVHGLQRAENYIEKIPVSFRSEVIYRTLLANCVIAVNVKKSEEVFNKIRDLEFPITVFVCNQLLLLYKRTDRKKIADVLLMMEKENVKPSLFTYKLLIDTKGSGKDIEGMEQVLETMKAEGVNPDQIIQAMVAKYYIFANQKEKAAATLKEMEGDDIKQNRDVCKLLLPLYGFLGKENDVERIWKFCEDNPRMNECLSAIEAWGKLGKIENAEKVFEDMCKTWKRIPAKYYNALLKVYANHKLLSKGKELAKRMSDAGCQIGGLTLDSLVTLYVEAGEVEKADSVLQKAAQRNHIRPLYSTYLLLMDNYAKRGDIHNAEKLFTKLRQFGYSGRIKQFQLLLQAYINAKAPAYGFRERMKADNIFPNKTLAVQLAAVDAFKKTPISDLLE